MFIAGDEVLEVETSGTDVQIQVSIAVYYDSEFLFRLSHHQTLGGLSRVEVNLAKSSPKVLEKMIVWSPQGASFKAYAGGAVVPFVNVKNTDYINEIYAWGN